MQVTYNYNIIKMLRLLPTYRDSTYALTVMSSNGSAVSESHAVRRSASASVSSEPIIQESPTIAEFMVGDKSIKLSR